MSALCKQAGCSAVCLSNCGFYMCFFRKTRALHHTDCGRGPRLRSRRRDLLIPTPSCAQPSFLTISFRTRIRARSRLKILQGGWQTHALAWVSKLPLPPPGSSRKVFSSVLHTVKTFSHLHLCSRAPAFKAALISSKSDLLEIHKYMTNRRRCWFQILWNKSIFDNEMQIIDGFHKLWPLTFWFRSLWLTFNTITWQRLLWKTSFQLS